MTVEEYTTESNVNTLPKYTTRTVYGEYGLVVAVTTPPFGYKLHSWGGLGNSIVVLFEKCTERIKE